MDGSSRSAGRPAHTKVGVGTLGQRATLISGLLPTFQAAYVPLFGESVDVRLATAFVTEVAAFQRRHDIV